MFGRLENRYCLTGRLKFESAFHVGSGAPEETVPIMVDGNDNPFIPGSSLRGVMRSVVERTLKGVAPDRTCVLFDATSHDECPTVNKDAKKLVEQKIERDGIGDTLGLLLSGGARGHWGAYAIRAGCSDRRFWHPN